eukprot:SAG31_NODE_6264_length_2096_cov_2.693540_2_plen_118_part_00
MCVVYCCVPGGGTCQCEHGYSGESCQRADVDCGQHGSCDGGTCQCEHGYSGESCQIFDSCADVDCGCKREGLVLAFHDEIQSTEVDGRGEGARGHCKNSAGRELVFKSKLRDVDKTR